MKPFEKNLKKLLDVYNETNESSFSNYRVNLSLPELNILKSKELISYIDFKNSNGIRITLAPSAFAYFDDRAEIQQKDRRSSRRYWITTIIAILALVLAGISLAAQLGLVSLPKA